MLRRFLLLILTVPALSHADNLVGQETTRPLLRVLTYNIHHGQGTDGRFDYDRLANVIKELNPDVAALQEVDRKTKRADGVDQAAHLAELLHMHHAYGKAMHYADGEYGEAILSRFPIKQVWNHPLPYRVGLEPRTAITVKIIPSNGLPPFIFIGTHLCHRSGETRLEQTQQLNLLFPAQEGPPTILAGDMNARPASAPMRELLDERWVDAVAPKSRIDYVLYRQHDPWKVREVTIVPRRCCVRSSPRVGGFGMDPGIACWFQPAHIHKLSQTVIVPKFPFLAFPDEATFRNRDEVLFQPWHFFASERENRKHIPKRQNCPSAPPKSHCDLQWQLFLAMSCLRNSLAFLPHNFLQKSFFWKFLLVRIDVSCLPSVACEQI